MQQHDHPFSNINVLCGQPFLLSKEGLEEVTQLDLDGELGKEAIAFLNDHGIPAELRTVTYVVVPTEFLIQGEQLLEKRARS